MNRREAEALGRRLAGLVESDRIEAAYALLAPVLSRRTPFTILDRIGETLGGGSLPAVNAFLDHVAAHKTLGGWPVIATALRGQLARDLPGAFERCQHFVIAADVWYGADILGERVPGPALVEHFGPTLKILAVWREHPNVWVRRTIGVGAHVWAKRSRGAPELAGRAGKLLKFLGPLFEEKEMDAVKGIGWGLKTLGRYYPALTAEWLARRVAQRPHHRSLMLRKALTYLPPKMKAGVVGQRMLRPNE